MPAADRHSCGLRGRCARFQIFAIGLVLVVGCDSQPPPRPITPPAAVAPPRVFPEGAARMAFRAAKLSWVTPEILQFEIPYKFTTGGPRHVYNCSIDFPGTTVRGSTPLSGGELSLDGVIKTKIAVGEADVKTFTIEMYEALSEDSKYYSISDSAPGHVPDRPEDSAANAEKKTGT